MLRPTVPTIDASSDWWRAVGFRFDPFHHLEASSDPHLIEYMVGHEVFSAAWDATPSLIYAPPGGGKTAMRLYTERACWSSFGPRHPFPIRHEPVLGEMDAGELPIAMHCQRLVSAAARSLLLGLTLQPDRLLDCSPAARAQVQRLLAALPRPLHYYTDILRTTGRATTLAPLLGKAPWLGASVAASAEKLCALADALDDPGIQSPSAPVDACTHFAEVCEVLLTALGYRTIFVLIDGVDALPESAHTPAIGVHWLHSLLDKGEQWAAQNVFLKGFLPTDYAELLVQSYPRHLFAQTTIRWGVESLAELLRRRIAVASGGAFGSLDAISSPALRDIETLIARRVPPLPREAIVFVRNLLLGAVRSGDTRAISVEPEHLEATTDWYREDCRQLDLYALAATPSNTRQLFF